MRASDTKSNPMISDQATRHDPPQCTTQRDRCQCIFQQASCTHYIRSGNCGMNG